MGEAEVAPFVAAHVMVYPLGLILELSICILHMETYLGGPHLT